MSADGFSYNARVSSRAKGHNAVAHAAYLAGQVLYDEQEARLHHFGRQERVMAKGIHIPADAPDWLRELAASEDRQKLWNMAEFAEGQGQHRSVYRSIIMAIDDGLFFQDIEGNLDREKTLALHRKLVAAHVKQFTDMGMVADWAIHWDEGMKNPHAHIMLTRRKATEKGFHHLKDGGEKSGSRDAPAPRPWNDRGLAEKWRENWAEVQNRELERMGLPYRLDHRSYARRGIEIQPENKHYNSAERKQANDRHHSKQVEQLIKNPRPVFDAIAKSYVQDFTDHDLQRYATRFSKGAGAQKGLELYQAMHNSHELIRTPEGRFTTQGIVAQNAQKALRQTLKNFSRIDSWQAFDRALAAVQLRAEAVCRNNRIVLDIISGAHPERRVSAYRVDQRFGPKTMQEKFGQTREEHERSQLIAHKRSHYRAWREEIAGDLQRQTHIQQEDFNRRYNAWRSRTEAHFQKADYIMVGEYIAYKVSEWLWERRRRKVERQQEAMRERAARAAAALRREEKQAVGEAASRHWAQLHAREERKRAARRQAEEKKAQAQEQQKQQDASSRRDKQFLEMYEEYKKAEDMLDRMALSRRAEAGEYGELTQRAYNLARHLTTSGAYWDRLKEQGADPIYIKKLQEFEQRQQRERTRDFGRGR
jgi:hypothetical protein